MRLRHGILALVLAASLTACGDDDTSNTSSEPAASSAPSSAPAATLDPSDVDTAKCADFLKGQAKAAELSSELTPGSDLSATIDAANAQFDALKEGAPEAIQEAIDGVKAAYSAIGEFYKDPAAMTGSAATKIQEAFKDLQENAMTLNNWIVENCS